jgi:hypothetical protein
VFMTRAFMACCQVVVAITCSRYCTTIATCLCFRSYTSMTQWHREWHRAMSLNLSPPRPPVALPHELRRPWAPLAREGRGRGRRGAGAEQRARWRCGARTGAPPERPELESADLGQRR